MIKLSESNQLTKFGNARTQNVFFLPKHFRIAINIKLPKKPPIYVADPTHDAISLFIGPLTSGVSFDCKTSSDGESHPIDPPCAKHARFAEFRFFESFNEQTFSMTFH